MGCLQLSRQHSTDQTRSLLHNHVTIIQLQCGYCKNCSVWFISRVSACLCTWHVSVVGDPTRGSSYVASWHSGLLTLSSLTLNIDLTLTPDPGCRGAEGWPLWLPGYITRLQRSQASEGADPAPSSVKSRISPGQERRNKKLIPGFHLQPSQHITPINTSR